MTGKLLTGMLVEWAGAGVECWTLVLEVPGSILSLVTVCCGLEQVTNPQILLIWSATYSSVRRNQYMYWSLELLLSRLLAHSVESINCFHIFRFDFSKVIAINTQVIHLVRMTDEVTLIGSITLINLQLYKLQDPFWVCSQRGLRLHPSDCSEILIRIGTIFFIALDLFFFIDLVTKWFERG